jgi:DNA repair photolyase
VPRNGVIEGIYKEGHKIHSNVLLCFTTDPYCHANEKYKITRKAIIALHETGNTATVLTKGGMRSLQDKDVMTDKDTYATTLTFTDEAMEKQYEPYAAPNSERLEALKYYHDIGLKTWVSIEPVVDPAQSLELIRKSADFVDLYKVGKLNHVKNETNWEDFYTSATRLLEELKKPYYIKEDLKKWGLKSNTLNLKGRLDLEETFSMNTSN